MDIWNAVLAGLVGTAVMTALIYVGPMMGMPRMDMLGMLGTMLTPNRGAAYGIGAVMHFAMGAVFAIVYAWLWSLGVGAPEWTSGLVFGLIHGVVAAAVMPVMLRMHPRPPEMTLGAIAILGLLMGHAAFGIVVGLVYTG